MQSSTLPPQVEAIVTQTEPVIDNHTDLGYTQAFCEQYGEDWRFVPERGTWLANNGLDIWEERPGGDNAVTGAVMTFVQGLSESYKNEGGPLLANPDPAIKKAGEELMKKATRVQQRATIQNIVYLSKAVPSIGVSVSQLDTDPYLIGTRSGVLDLRTGEIVSGPIDSYITSEAPVYWNPGAKCPQFETYLKQILKDDTDLLTLMLKWLGYSLSGLTREQKFMILLGERGRNGKGVLFKTMEDILGRGYCSSIDKSIITVSRRDNRFSLSVLEGKRAVLASETNDQARLDVEFIKGFAAGDTMFAERKGQQGYDFKPQAKLIFALNTLPFAKFDPSFRNRIIPVPLTQSFYDPAKDLSEYQEGDLPQDKDLPNKLARERDGIFALWVQAFQLYLKEGLEIPTSVTLLAHQFEQQNDYVGQWITECCRLGTEERERAGVLFEDFRQFCDRRRFPAPNRTHEFVNRLKVEPGITRIFPGNISTFKGICLDKQAGSVAPYWGDR